MSQKNDYRWYKVQTVLQVTKSDSPTGFIKIVAVDPSPPHPAAGFKSWNYIIRNYDPTKPGKKSGERRISRDALETIVLRNKS